MGNNPAVLFYPNDFIASTALWSDAETGLYIRLLCYQHINGGIQPEDFEQLCGDCRKVRAKFVQHDDGLYYNERMLTETNKRRAYVQSRVENGEKGGRPKNHMDNHMDSHMRNRNINSNNIPILESNTSLGEEKRGVGKKEEKNDAQFDALFARFWQAYPRKVSKQEARRAFIKLKPTEAFTDMLINAVIAQKKWDKGWQEDVRFIPHASTWLNQARWEDEQTKIPAQPRYGNFDPEEAMERAIARSFKKEI
jgi:hypothetical protein